MKLFFVSLITLASFGCQTTQEVEKSPEIKMVAAEVVKPKPQKAKFQPKPVKFYYQPYYQLLNKYKMMELIQAEEKQHLGAIMAVGVAYEKGIRAPVNYRIAKEQYLKAIGIGGAPGYFALGMMFENGLGFKKNLPMAISLYFISLEDGYSKAHHRLSELNQKHPKLFVGNESTGLPKPKACLTVKTGIIGYVCDRLKDQYTISSIAH